MGGQSFKCTKCEYWSLGKLALKQHLRDKHLIWCSDIQGVGPLCVLINERPWKGRIKR